MTAMFPDSGVPYTDARNSLSNPIVQPNCNPLWYSTSRCQARFDPAAANMMLSEIINVINQGEVRYDCSRNDQLEFAIRYLIQRGLCCSAYLTGGPFMYLGMLDPPATRYNNFMAIVIVPSVDNQGAVQVAFNGLEYLPLLRNDGQPLESGDLKANRPALIVGWNDRWYMVGLCASQVPLLLQGGVDIWIRTDGNDTTGDGSANSPDKAFRTINGAWARAGNRYASTPLFQMNLRLGIPGTYEGGSIGPFGGTVGISGDEGNPGAYKIAGAAIGNDNYSAITVSSIGRCKLNGITMMRDISGYRDWCAWLGGSTTIFTHCLFDSAVSNPNSGFITIGGGSTYFGSDTVFYGRGGTLGNLIRVGNGGTLTLGAGIPPAITMSFIDCPVAAGGACFISNSLGIFDMEPSSVLVPNYVNCTGVQYAVIGNSIMSVHGQPVPGDSPGYTSNGGQFY